MSRKLRPAGASAPESQTAIMAATKAARPVGERVLLIAPVGHDADAMAAVLKAEGVEAQICKSCADCVQYVIEGAGALLVTEEALELPQTSELFAVLRAQPPWSELPVIILSSGGKSRLGKLLDLMANAAGAATLLERPVNTATLTRSVQVALNSRRCQYQVRDLLETVSERAKLAHLRADINLALISGESLPAVLQHCAEALVKNLDAAFARIWTLNELDNVLELEASAGLYTHKDGPHSRVKVGEFKIGRIALNAQPHLTNDVPHDKNISDPEWARAEGMVAFAGYPMMLDDRVLGVMAMFAKTELSEAVLSELALIAAGISQWIQRKRAEQALRDSEERYRTLFESMDEGFCIIELAFDENQHPTDFRVLEINPVFEKQTGLKDAKGKWMRELVPTLEQHWFDTYGRVALTGEPIRFENSAEALERVYEVYAFRTDDPKKHRVGIVFNDITKRKRAEEVLREAKEEAETASRAKDDFLAALSHELRTPLTPVLMTASALREDESLSSHAREQLAMIERNVALEARLIDDLLDLTRISRGKLVMRAEKCDIHSLIGLVVEIVRDEAREKKINIGLDLAARRSSLTGDAARLQQVFWNLLRNAVKFTPAGGTIRIQSHDGQLIGNAEQSNICVKVSDDGIGLDPATVQRIFEPFEQVSPRQEHRFGGLGLGLAIARAIVDLHHGAIRAESLGPGCGSTFTVELPGAVAPPTETPPANLGHAEAGAKTSTIEPPMRLLVVEDHDATLQVLTRLLSRCGHTVTGAGSVAAARSVAAAKQFDAVISDLGLPDGTGIELMEYLRAEYNLRGIVLSGYGMEEDLRRSREAGFIAHLVKPVDLNQLRRALHQLYLANTDKG